MVMAADRFKRYGR